MNLAQLRTTSIDTRDPILASWALDQLERLAGDQSHEDVEAILFPATWLETLWASAHTELRSRLIDILSPKTLAPLSPAFARQWHSDEHLGYELAIALATSNAKLAAQSFADVMRQQTGNTDAPLMDYIAEALLHVEAEERLQFTTCAEQLFAYFSDTWHSSASGETYGKICAIACRYGSANATPLFQGMHAKLRGQALAEAQQALAFALPEAFKLFGHLMDLEEGLTTQTVQSFAFAFRDVELVDEIITLLERPSLTAYLRLLDISKLQEYSEIARSTCALFQQEPTDETLASVCRLAAALALGSLLKSEQELMGLPTSDALKLYGLDIQDWKVPALPPHSLRSLSPEALTAALQDMLQDSETSWALGNMFKLVECFHPPMLLSTTLQCLSDYAEPGARANVRSALCAYGDAATLAITSRWDDLDDSQYVPCMEALAVLGGPATVDFLTERFEECSDYLIESWCTTASAQPDQRLFALCEQEIDQDLLAVNKAFYAMGKLLHIDHPQLAQIGEHAADQERRFSAYRNNFEDVESVTIEMACTSCGHSNTYDIETLWLSESGEIAFEETLQCIACDEAGSLEPSNRGQQIIGLELDRVTNAQQHGLEVGSPIIFEESDDDAGNCCDHDHGHDHHSHDHGPQEHHAHTHDGDCCNHDHGHQPQQSESRSHDHGDHTHEVGTSDAHAHHHHDGCCDHDHHPQEPFVRGEKIGRNDACPCGSGKKHKKCCGSH